MSCAEMPDVQIVALDRLAGARRRFEHAGKVYAFCCPHCRADFARDAERYVAALQS
jgi:hypothetical protein